MDSEEGRYGDLEVLVVFLYFNFFPSVAPQKQFRSSGAGGFFGFKREMRGEMVDGI